MSFVCILYTVTEMLNKRGKRLKQIHMQIQTGKETHTKKIKTRANKTNEKQKQKTIQKERKRERKISESARVIFPSHKTLMYYPERRRALKTLYNFLSSETVTRGHSLSLRLHCLSLGEAPWLQLFWKASLPVLSFLGDFVIFVYMYLYRYKFSER